MKNALKQIGLMTSVMVGVWSFISGLTLGLMGFVDPSTFGPEEALGPLPSLILVSILNVLVIVWFIHNTKLSGMKLGMLVFIIIFGVMFFMTQIETVYFNNVIEMPWQIIFSTVLTGVGVGLVMSLLSMRYQKKLQETNPPSSGEESYPEKQEDLILKFIALTFVYLVFYFILGYYVAWQFPTLREYYSGSTDIIPFIKHMQNQVNTDTGLIFFQIFRGFLWTGIGYLVAINTESKKKWERVVIVGLALSVGLATPLLVPNEYMPAAVRLGHFFEVLSQNFIFGALCALWFRPRNKA